MRDSLEGTSIHRYSDVVVVGVVRPPPLPSALSLARPLTPLLLSQHYMQVERSRHQGYLYTPPTTPLCRFRQRSDGRFREEPEMRRM